MQVQICCFTIPTPPIFGDDMLEFGSMKIKICSGIISLGSLEHRQCCLSLDERHGNRYMFYDPEKVDASAICQLCLTWDFMKLFTGQYKI